MNAKKRGLELLAKVLGDAAVRADGKTSEYGTYQPKKPARNK